MSTYHSCRDHASLKRLLYCAARVNPTCRAARKGPDALAALAARRVPKHDEYSGTRRTHRRTGP